MADIHFDENRINDLFSVPFTYILSCAFWTDFSLYTDSLCDLYETFLHLSMAVLLVAKALCMPVAEDHCVADRFSFPPEPCRSSSSKERLQTTIKPNRKAKTET